MRPTTLDEIIGQEHLLGEGKLLRNMIESNRLPFGMVFFGPPGCTKTTLAKIISTTIDSNFIFLSATAQGVKEIRKAANDAINILEKEGKETVIAIDEAHRMAKNQQDVLLPLVEEGFIHFIGITTSNPYFAINGALLSRSELFEFKPFSEKELLQMVVRAKKHFKEQGLVLNFERSAIRKLIERSSGDARKLYNIIDAISFSCDEKISDSMINEVAPNNYLTFDIRGEEHFDCASWMQGAIQASDPDTAIYALAKWLESGEDPRYIARRIIVSASEDAAGSPEAAMVALSACRAADQVGRPECDIVLAHAVTTIATCPRDKSAANAIWQAIRDVRNGTRIHIPDSLKDCHYKGASKLGRGSYNDGANQDQYIGINKKYYNPPITSKYAKR